MGKLLRLPLLFLCCYPSWFSLNPFQSRDPTREALGRPWKESSSRETRRLTEYTLLLMRIQRDGRNSRSPTLGPLPLPPGRNIIMFLKSEHRSYVSLFKLPNGNDQMENDEEGVGSFNKPKNRQFTNGSYHESDKSSYARAHQCYKSNGTISHMAGNGRFGCATCHDRLRDRCSLAQSHNAAIRGTCLQCNIVQQSPRKKCCCLSANILFYPTRPDLYAADVCWCSAIMLSSKEAKDSRV